MSFGLQLGLGWVRMRIHKEEVEAPAWAFRSEERQAITYFEEGLA